MATTSVPFSRDERHQVAAMDQLERHRLERVGLDRDLGQIDELHAELVGQDGQDVLFLGEALLEEEQVQGPLRLHFGGGLQGRHVFVPHQAFGDEQLKQVHAVQSLVFGRIDFQSVRSG